MDFDDLRREQLFRHLWEAVRIERSVPYSLFTFGDSDLPYHLVVGARRGEETVTVSSGQVRITRPLIVTADNARPEFRGFFEDPEHEGLVDFLLARTAGFRHLKLDNTAGRSEIVTDTVEEAVDRLTHRLDAEDEDRVAVLSAPPGLGGVALLKYAAERVASSAEGNVQELRERGFLP